MEKILTLDQIQGMSIDNIVCLYRDGYRVEENPNLNIPTLDQNSDQKIVTAQGISISNGALLLIGLGVFAYFIYKK